VCLKHTFSARIAPGPKGLNPPLKAKLLSPAARWSAAKRRRLGGRGLTVKQPQTSNKNLPICPMPMSSEPRSYLWVLREPDSLARDKNSAFYVTISRLFYYKVDSLSRLYIFYKNVKLFGGGHETPTLTERSEVGQFARRLKISTTPKSL